MNYLELAEKIKNLTPEQQQMTVTMKLDDEWFPINTFNITEEVDVLDKDHPYLEIN